MEWGRMLSCCEIGEEFGKGIPSLSQKARKDGHPSSEREVHDGEAGKVGMGHATEADAEGARRNGGSGVYGGGVGVGIARVEALGRQFAV